MSRPRNQTTGRMLRAAEPRLYHGTTSSSGKLLQAFHSCIPRLTQSRELKAARDQLSQMQAKIDRLMQMMENLDMWSGALNPVVSMLLENMGNPNALESKNVENWLNVSESSEPSDWTNC